MNRLRWALAALVLLVAAAPAAAQESGQALLQQSGLRNLALIRIDGNANSLIVDQLQSDRSLLGNVIRISISGDRNGGLIGGSRSSLFDSSVLEPGLVTQSGAANRIDLSVTGSDNQFGLRQVGIGNSLSGVISGAANQVAVMQVGGGNAMAFAQSGSGNILSVVQRAR